MNKTNVIKLILKDYNSQTNSKKFVSISFVSKILSIFSTKRINNFYDKYTILDKYPTSFASCVLLGPICLYSLYNYLPFYYVSKTISICLVICPLKFLYDDVKNLVKPINKILIFCLLVFILIVLLYISIGELNILFLDEASSYILYSRPWDFGIILNGPFESYGGPGGPNGPGGPEGGLAAASGAGGGGDDEDDNNNYNNKPTDKLDLDPEEEEEDQAEDQEEDQADDQADDNAGDDVQNRKELVKKKRNERRRKKYEADRLDPEFKSKMKAWNKRSYAKHKEERNQKTAEYKVNHKEHLLKKAREKYEIDKHDPEFMSRKREMTKRSKDKKRKENKDKDNKHKDNKD